MAEHGLEDLTASNIGELGELEVQITGLDKECETVLNKQFSMVLFENFVHSAS